MKGGEQRGVREQRGPSERHMKGGTGWLHTLLTPQSPRHPSLLLEKLWKIAQINFLLEFKNFFWVQELFINAFFGWALLFLWIGSGVPSQAPNPLQCTGETDYAGRT